MSTVANGYGVEHKAERRKHERAMQAGHTYQCACKGDCGQHQGPCPTTLGAGDRWDLGHTRDRNGWVGPECIPCNRGRGARNSNTTATMIIRDWP